MATIHNLGFPRIGAKRELKFGLESYWKKDCSEEQLMELASNVRKQNWDVQSDLDYVPVGDFSLYDQVLDMSFMLGNIPRRVVNQTGNKLDKYFRVARGRSVNDSDCSCVHAGEMTKWFDTNYHYIVPEFDALTRFTLHVSGLLDQVNEAKAQGVRVKPVIIGPVSYLWLGKEQDDSSRLDLLPRLLPIYADLLIALEDAGCDWVQIDEPILVTELNAEWRHALNLAYHYLKNSKIEILLTTYFGSIRENLQLACELPVSGIHLDAISGYEDVHKLVDWLPTFKVLSLGIINGRNVWKTDLRATLDWLEPIHSKLKDRLWIAPSCSLLHVPVDLDSEHNIDAQIKSWLAFAKQKLDEITIIGKALNDGRGSVGKALFDNVQSLHDRRTSKHVNDQGVKSALSQISEELGKRQSRFSVRKEKQRKYLNLPSYPTTTIGSFPQTTEIRQARFAYRKNEIHRNDYTQLMQQEIKRVVEEQETLGLDVLVHGEAERNDMVEYFGEQLDGYAFSQFGWVQSYGSRCVKPPIIFGDIKRPHAMTVEWTRYAQSLTNKPMKGMLTGPVTMLNWSFVRDDQSRSESCYQLALAIREEVIDLEKAGINIIQIDEAALREGLPLRKSDWREYLNWAIDAFRIAANGVEDETQIHTHMCYSEFNDIIDAITEMDADVITIETSRSNMELLDAFDNFEYPNEIGPGVYDIHSPNIPDVAHMVDLMKKASEKIPAENLWVNPDCGLKTRNWKEVLPALKNMVQAAEQLRAL